MAKPEKYHNKYRISSARNPNWDYASNGAYFITICTQHRIPYFGEIHSSTTETQNSAAMPSHNTIQLTQLGQHAQQCALDIPNHFPFVQINEFIVMPDHVHLLLTIGRDAKFCVSTNKPSQNHGNQFCVSTNKPSQNHGNQFCVSTNKPSQNHGNQFGPQSKNIASIIRGFKIGVTLYARKQNIPFQWQARFHDHIVRNANNFDRIANYIKNNLINYKSNSMNT